MEPYVQQNAQQFGTLGVILAISTWMIGFGAVLVGSALVGRVVSEDPTVGHIVRSSEAAVRSSWARLRPADATETLECWEIAIAHLQNPSVLALSRQNLPALRTEYVEENLSAKGAYVIAGDKNADVVIFGTGSEVSIAVEAQKKLAEEGIAAKVVSVPSMELFYQQPDAYRAEVIGTPRSNLYKKLEQYGITQETDG